MRGPRRFSSAAAGVVAGALTWGALASSAPAVEPPTVPGTPAGRPAASPQKPNIILITVESLRRDHVGCFVRGATEVTPAIDALAARGVRFDRAYAASASTAPSIATILTGRTPAHHGLRHDLFAWLDAGTPTVATVLKRSGYRTGAILGSFHLDSDRGLAGGFDLYDADIEGVRKNIVGRSRERVADDVVGRGIHFLESGSKSPFLLWLDFYDPHYDYDPPEPFKTRYAKDPYDGEVANVDSAVGRLIGTLRERGLLAGTWIVLVASHGEALGERGETGHGTYLYENTIRVPLLIVPPEGLAAGGAVAGGAQVGAVVGLVDLAPTIFDLLGATPPAALEGVSLRALLTGGAPDRTRPAYVEAAQPYEAYGWSALFAVIDGDRKIVSGQRLEAFDLAADPGEAAPLQPVPPWASELERIGRSRLGSLATPASIRREVKAQVDRLAPPWRDSPVCLEKETWPDPRDRSSLEDPLFRARIAADHGFAGTAETLATGTILPADPANRTGLELAGFLALRNGAEERLLELLQLLQCNYPYQATAYHFWGHHLERHKDPARAELAFRIFATLEPRSEEPFYDLAVLDASQGRKDLAFENLKKSIDRGARDLDFIRKDRRLLALHGDPRFARLAGSVPPAPTQKKR